MESKKITILLTESEKVKTMLELRGVMNSKYNELLKNKRKAYKLYNLFVRKGEEGRILRDKLKGPNPSDLIPKSLTKIKEDILKY